MSQDYAPVTKYLPRSSNFIDHFKNELGKIDSDVSFDNEFQSFKLIIKCMNEMNQAIKQKIINVPDEILPDKQTMDELDKIWYGGCYYGIVRDKTQTKVIERKLYFDEPPEVLYDENNETYPVEPIELPALISMIPVNQIKDPTWAIQVRTTLPLYIAWQDASYETILTDGNFVANLSDSINPRVNPDDLHSTTLRTAYIHRPVYFRITSDLAMQFQRKYDILNMNWQSIISHVENTDISWLTDEVETNSDSIVVEN